MVRMNNANYLLIWEPSVTILVEKLKLIAVTYKLKLITVTPTFCRFDFLRYERSK